MSENSITIKYQGFHPAEFTNTFLNKKMEELLLQAPHGARISGIFTRKNHTFKGALTISSPVGKFFAVATHTRLREVNRRMFGQLRHQLDKWKSKKYQHEGLRHMSVHPPEVILPR